MVKFRHLISREAKSNKCYVKYVFWKIFKNLYKTIKESNSCNIADLFHSKNTQRELGHSKDIQGTLIGHLSTCWALQWHSKNTWALKALRHSSTWDTQALDTPLALGLSWHLGTWTLQGYLGTHTLRHSSNWKIEALEVLYLEVSYMSIDIEQMTLAFIKSFICSVAWGLDSTS